MLLHILKFNVRFHPKINTKNYQMLLTAREKSDLLYRKVVARLLHHLVVSSFAETIMVKASRKIPMALEIIGDFNI